jgi:aminomethyltransferase
MVPFAGYSMPVQYPTGIIAEHTHVRTAAGLFDVSHMGQAVLVGPDHETTARALEALAPGDFVGLAPGRERYSLLSRRWRHFDDLTRADVGRARRHASARCQCRGGDRPRPPRPRGRRRPTHGGARAAAPPGPQAATVLPAMSPASRAWDHDCTACPLRRH